MNTPRRYLLLDDNRAFAENLAEILSDAGDEAQITTSCAEALEAVQHTRFDAFLTDMRMPGMSGAEAVHALRHLDPGLAAVVITAYPGESDLEAARREGLLAVLPKPVPLPWLTHLLQKARRNGLVALVEDDEALCDNLTEALQSQGFSTVTAASIALTDNLEGVRPFAALVDWRLPGGAEGEALLRLRARFPALPLILMTAHEVMPIPEEVTALFAKPFRVDLLLSTLETLHRQAETA